MRVSTAQSQAPVTARFEGRRREMGARTGSERVLLLWGSLDRSGNLALEPAFIVNAPPVLPSVGGAYELKGLTTDGEELFTLSFDIREESDGGATSFVFALPAPAEWAGRLARITLSGSGGSASLDGREGPSMTILRDARTGRVRGFLRDQGTEVASDAAAQVGEPGLEVLFSAGVPAGEVWSR